MENWGKALRAMAPFNEESWHGPQGQSPNVIRKNQQAPEWDHWNTNTIGLSSTPPSLVVTETLVQQACSWPPARESGKKKLTGEKLLDNPSEIFMA